MITMNNGLSVLTKNIANAKYYNITLCFKAGPIFENKNENGISHLIEHMMFRKLGNYTYDDIINICNKMGTELRGKTGIDFMSFSMSFLQEDLEKALELFYLLFETPLWSIDDLKKEKEIVIHEIMTNSVNQYDHSLKKLLFTSDSHCRSVLGNASTIKGLSLKSVLEFKKRIFNTENCKILVSGNITDKIEKKIFDVFGKIKTSESKLQNISFVPPNFF